MSRETTSHLLSRAFCNSESSRLKVGGRGMGRKVGHARLGENEGNS